VQYLHGLKFQVASTSTAKDHVMCASPKAQHRPRPTSLCERYSIPTAKGCRVIRASRKLNAAYVLFPYMSFTTFRPQKRAVWFATSRKLNAAHVLLTLTYCRQLPERDFHRGTDTGNRREAPRQTVRQSGRQAGTQRHNDLSMY